MTRAFVGLGSNLDEPAAQLERAFEALAALPGTRLVARSPVYRTAPVGDPDQPEFRNAVAELATTLAAPDLLAAMQDVERRQGRRRDPRRRFGPRTIDLDLLMYGDSVIRQPGLVVPHPRLAGRAFVLRPLADLAPALEIPGLGRVADLLAGVDTRGVRPAGPPGSVEGDSANEHPANEDQS
ncbi:MAG: 2-amino-4-hydroxy-6-hydroxymethyldihydropteridine diphosphokinase [Wenzhouxiangellaceae bacterium]|nr:2-amino-4-hydroxy-6-hydroxymethyldihydropteridine diphosphokinase [Wenzhouxiangellaceae bacterium]